MLLLLEVGNTNTSVGVHDGTRLVASWRLTSRREQTADEYGVFIHTLLRSRALEPKAVTAVAISNVVPPVQRTLEWMCDAYFGVAPFSVLPGVNAPIAFDVDNPLEVGADRICNAVAAAALYGPPLIVVDFGTATNIQSGVVLGYAGLVDGLIERMRRELGGDVKVIGTGGLAAQMRELARSIQVVNPDLRLEGLRMIWEHSRKGG